MQVGVGLEQRVQPGADAHPKERFQLHIESPTRKAGEGEGPSSCWSLSGDHPLLRILWGSYAHC